MNPEPTTPMKYQVTYWLTLSNRDVFYEYKDLPLLCKGFAQQWLGGTPRHVKLTLSPFKRRGYTRALISTHHRDAEITTPTGTKYHALYRSLYETIRAHSLTTLWFKLEEWK